MLSEKRMSEKRKCPYCGKELVERPYWRHIEREHGEEYATDKATWIQLFKDYTSAGMDKDKSIEIICEIFNKKESEIVEFLQTHGEL